jgi:hypothetical protein
VTFYIVDSLPSTGKTSACINMMNENADERYLFVTPFIDETDRIVKACKSRGFEKPKEQEMWSPYKKLDDLHRLLREKKNIASTHALFFNYTDETRQLIREGEYILVLDEVIDPLQQVGEEDVNLTDLDLAMRKGVFDVDGDKYSFKDEEYEKKGGEFLKNVNKKLKSRKLIRGDDGVAFWGFNADTLRCFKKGYLLTYMFEHQPMRQFIELCGIEYQYLGVKKAGGKYQFCPPEGMDRRIDLTDKIHILDDEKLNELGDEFYNLSLNWFKRGNEKKEKELKDNIYNYFRNKLGGTSEDRMWTSFKCVKDRVKGKGYSKGFVAFNMRATNKYGHKKYIAYGVNVFMQPWKVRYFKKHGARDINQDMWALSYCLQFLFRSRIRRGEEIWVYIPSRRMRELLKRWLINLKEGRDLEEIILDKKLK